MSTFPFEREDFHWRAHYDDGEILDERPDAGFKSVDLERLVAFELIPTRPGLPRPVVQLNDDMRVIFFRRRAVTISPDGSPDAPLSRQTTATCLGWQKTINGRNVAVYCFHFADGSVLVTDDYQAI